jgi:hypothetical protein
MNKDTDSLGNPLPNMGKFINDRRFIHFIDGKAYFGLIPNAPYIIDLERKHQGLRTNPDTSCFDERYGYKWEELNWTETRYGPFICDDDDNYLWLCENTLQENGAEYSTQEEMIDNGLAEVCINIKDMTFYDKVNGCYLPINAHTLHG